MNKIPFFAPIPDPTITATGVASPNAQGQLTTRTLMALARLKGIPFPMIIHTIKVTRLIPITAGTKTADILSASLAMGAFVAAASLTMFMICDRVVSLPVLVAFTFTRPVRLTAAEMTMSPCFLSTGTDSPVTSDSSEVVMPSRIIPSQGKLSPGRTTTVSPSVSSSAGITISEPSLITVQVWGASFIRLFRASVVLPLEYCSSVLPTVTRVRIIEADSK